MEKFGYFDKLNGIDHLPFWPSAPCNSISASEGSFFPPRDVTHSDVVHVYDKDLCRSLPLVYRKPVVKDGEFFIKNLYSKALCDYIFSALSLPF